MNKLRIHYIPLTLALLLIFTVACTTNNNPNSDVQDIGSTESASSESNTSSGNLPNVNPNPTSDNIITLDPGIRYQTMLGWEGVAQIGQDWEGSPTAVNLWKDEITDRAVNELGLNRIRLEAISGIENPTGYFQQWQDGIISGPDWRDHLEDIQNDDSDPFSINWNGFQFAVLDRAIETVVIPMKNELEANGEKLYINLNYVDFGASSFEHHNNPNEYAEFILAVFIHMRDKYGFVPDGVEIILEPDNSSGWSGTQIGQVMVATGDRLKSEGFATPDFIAPSTMRAKSAVGYLNDMLKVPGVAQYLSELSYHRYRGQPSQSQLQDIANRASQLGIDTSMLEKIKAGYEKLHEDIKYGNVSSWQQFTIAFPTKDNGAQYYYIDSNGSLVMGKRTQFLRQYFKPVRSGAQRIGASSNTGKFDPLAFINTNGSYAVVVKASNGGGDFSIEGLPAGKYGISYSVGNGIQSSADVTISAGQTLDALIPNDGVISIFAKTPP